MYELWPRILHQAGGFQGRTNFGLIGIEKKTNPYCQGNENLGILTQISHNLVYVGAMVKNPA